MVLPQDSVSRRTLKGFGQKHPVPESFTGEWSAQLVLCVLAIHRKLPLRHCQGSGPERQGVIAGVSWYLGAAVTSSQLLNSPSTPHQATHSISSMSGIRCHTFLFLPPDI